MFIQSLRMTARDWRAGELRFLLVALIVAVSALSSVGFFIDRMRAGLNRDAHQLLGADSAWLFQPGRSGECGRPRACCVHSRSRRMLQRVVSRASSRVQMIPYEHDLL